MWHANMTRRQVLELILAGEAPPTLEAADISDAAVGGENAFDVFWMRKPDGSVGDLPVLIMVDDELLNDAIAMLASSPQVPSPFTAFCRVIPRSLASLLSVKTDSVRADVIHGLTGLALAEATIYSAGAVKPADVSPAACKRTLSFVYGRALTQVPVKALPSVIGNWLEAHTVLGVSAPGFDRVSEALLPILKLASRVYLGQGPEDALSALVIEMIEFGEPSELAWKDLSKSHLRVPTLKFFSEANREQRSAAFQEIVRGLYSGDYRMVSEEAVASCALAATRISPGTFEHLGLLSNHTDSRLPLWYAFFATLQRHGSALRASSASALRVMRDMGRLTTFQGVPTADISSDELRLVYRKNIEALGKKLSHSNEILVEIFPGIDASFRFGQRSERRESVTQADAALAVREKTPAEKLDAARRLLDEVSRDFSHYSAGAKPQRAARKKNPKTDRLL
ncbi:hypothetical protein [uncultured Xanthomonas sp.]|uniref:hypothetical protein n=1 Tax=uncultured Xanthomonas sp. TaxID=152831 RepID=UPI0025F97017|nr:hypothetical protein [uncultured Xanthomonas sp.]